MNLFEHGQKLQSLHGPSLLILLINDNVEYTMSNNHSCEIALSTHSGGTHRSCAFLSFFRRKPRVVHPSDSRSGALPQGMM